MIKIIERNTKNVYEVFGTRSKQLAVSTEYDKNLCIKDFTEFLIFDTDDELWYWVDASEYIPYSDDR